MDLTSFDKKSLNRQNAANPAFVWAGVVFFIIFLWFFAIYDIDFRGPDEPIYFAYTASLAEDGDLNAVNHYVFPDRIEISSSYNFPDFHNHGGVVIWAPFYLYAKVAYRLLQVVSSFLPLRYSLGQVITCNLSFSTLIIGFLTILFTYFFSKKFFSARLSFFTTLAVVLGTPFFYYLLFEPANANIPAAFFSVLSLWFCSQAGKFKRSGWFCYGVFFSICITVKVDLWFQSFFILAVFLFLIIHKRLNWTRGIYFLLGVVPGMLLKMINDYIKFGNFYPGELILFSGADSLHLELLFSSYHGYLYTSPVLGICFLGWIILGINIFGSFKHKDYQRMENEFFLLALGFYLVLKVIFIGYGFAWGGGTVGARNLLTEFPVFVLLFGYLLRFTRKPIKYVLVISSIIFIAWNLLVVSEYIAKVNLQYIVLPPGLLTRAKMLSNLLTFLTTAKHLGLKLICSFPIIAIAAALIGRRLLRGVKYSSVISGNKGFQSVRMQAFLIAVTVYAFGAYYVVTVLNIYNNPRKVARLKKAGFFNTASLLDPVDFGKSENTGSLDEMTAYFHLKGDESRVNKIKKYKNKLYGDKNHVR